MRCVPHCERYAKITAIGTDANMVSLLLKIPSSIDMMMNGRKNKFRLIDFASFQAELSGNVDGIRFPSGPYPQSPQTGPSHIRRASVCTSASHGRPTSAKP